MGKKTLKQEVEQIKNDMGNVRVTGHTVWNTEQIADVITELDTQKAILKIEITHGFDGGYNMIVWSFPPLT